MLIYESFDTKKYGPGSKIDLGSHIFTAEEIIEFAKRFDPLEFHTHQEVAEQSIFKGLISSGPHPFNYFHSQKWIPLFGKTVICGLEVTNWKFLKPTYAGKEIKCRVTIDELRVNELKKHVVVSWRYDITNEKGEAVQVLQTKVMHYFEALPAK